MSKRLGFRMLEDQDLQNLMRLDMNPEVRAFFPEGVSTPEQLRQKIIRSRKSFLQKGFGEFSVTDLKTNEFLGRAGFAELKNGEIEVGYLLLKEYWGKGIATEALCALLDWAGKTLSVPRIVAYAPNNHQASIGVMKKAGMRYLKTEPSHGVECTFYEFPLKPRAAPAES
jgi:RimJ/RimL family protein N-acetyltransferase